MGHSFHEIFLHINWHCKNDAPLIKKEMEEELFNFIQNYCYKVKGVAFKGVGGTKTHVHLIIQIDPTMRLSEIIGKIKGASSHEMNKIFPSNRIVWQRGYGIVSFAKKNLKGIAKYVSNQKKHHKTGNIVDVLEKFCD